MTGEAARGVTAVGSEVWVSAGLEGRLVRVDAYTRAVTGPTPTGPSPAQIAATPAGLWVTDRENNAVVLADPNGGAVLASGEVGAPTIGIATDEHSVGPGQRGPEAAPYGRLIADLEGANHQRRHHSAGHRAVAGPVQRVHTIGQDAMINLGYDAPSQARVRSPG